MELLVYENAYRRMSEALGADVVTRVQEDGTLRRGDDTVEAEALRLDAAYAAPGMFGGGGAKGFFRTLLKSPTARWFHSGAAGLDDPVFPRIAAKGVVMTVNDAAAIGMAEYVLAEVLAQFQRIGERRRLQADREWKKLGFREIAGSTWAIIGLGAIGQAVAVRAKAFGATVIGVRSDPSKGGPADEVYGTDSLPHILPRADVVVIATPLTDSTRDMVNGEFLVTVKDGSVLVNVGRGAIVDEDALLVALGAGKLAHAVLDVFRTEPLPAESPLWAHPKISMTSHTSALGSGFLARSDALFIDNLRRFRAGESLRNQVTL